MGPYVRTVKTKSGATAVQIMWSRRGGHAQVEHLGSAHGEVELAALRQVAQERLHGGQDPLGLEVGMPRVAAAPFPILSSSSARLCWALERAWAGLGFDHAVTDEAFRLEVLARVVEPTSKRDSLRVLRELGVDWVPAYRTVKQCLVRAHERDYRGHLEAACATHAGVEALTLCLYDVTTLYWETDEADQFRQPGYSKERRLEPQILVGLLTAPSGFPLMVRAFEGNKAETKTIVPVLDQFRSAHPAARITSAADAGMMSESNLIGLEQAGYGFIVGGRIPRVPGEISWWLTTHPGEEFTDAQTWRSACPGSTRHRTDWTIFYQYRAERARKNLHGIDQTLSKARKIVDGISTAKKNRFLQETGGTCSIDEALVASARLRAGIRSYMTNLTDPDPVVVIGTYHQLWHVENSFRMSKHDLRARPAYHRLRERIEAHLTIVFTALAISKWIEAATGVTLRAFLHAVRPIRQVVLDIGGTTATGEDHLSEEVTAILNTINTAAAPPHHTTRY